MKILILAQKEFPYKNGQFVGGIQKVEADQVRALASISDTQVEIFMPSDTDEKTFSELPNVTVIRSAKPSQDQLAPGAKAKITRHRTGEIKSLLRNKKFDCVIVHDWSVAIHEIFASEFKHIPSIIYLHNMPCDSGGIQMFDRINKYTKLHRQGSISAVVSNTCRQQWLLEIERKIKSPAQAKFLHDETIEYFSHSKEKIFDVMWPGMLEAYHQPQLSKLRFATMISRLNDNKRIDLGAKIAHEAGIPLFLFCPSPKNEEQQAILDSFCKYHPISNVMMDHDRAEMMDMLTRSSLHIIPSIESFSLVALEANSCGVPCLIVDRGYLNSPHEATQMNDIYNISYNTRLPKQERADYLAEKMETIPLTIGERERISERIYQFYSIYQVRARLAAKITEAIERKQAFLSDTTLDDGIFSFA